MFHGRMIFDCILLNLIKIIRKEGGCRQEINAFCIHYHFNGIEVDGAIITSGKVCLKFCRGVEPCAYWTEESELSFTYLVRYFKYVTDKNVDANIISKPGKLMSGEFFHLIIVTCSSVSQAVFF